MKKDEIVNELLKSANENGVITTLYGVFCNFVKVRVPFSPKACKRSIKTKKNGKCGIIDEHTWCVN